MEYYRGSTNTKFNRTKLEQHSHNPKGYSQKQNPPKTFFDSYSRIPTQRYHRAVDCTGSLTKVDVTGFVVHSAV